MSLAQQSARMAWSEEEDHCLRAAVARYGVKRWAQIAALLPGRTSKACSHRWRTYLQPGVMHTNTLPFTDWEVAVVKEAHSVLGNNWSAIAKMLPGRTNAAVKNFWYAHKRRSQRAHGSHGPGFQSAVCATAGSTWHATAAEGAAGAGFDSYFDLECDEVLDGQAELGLDDGRYNDEDLGGCDLDDEEDLDHQDVECYVDGTNAEFELGADHLLDVNMIFQGAGSFCMDDLLPGTDWGLPLPNSSSASQQQQHQQLKQQHADNASLASNGLDRWQAQSPPEAAGLHHHQGIDALSHSAAKPGLHSSSQSSSWSGSQLLQQTVADSSASAAGPCMSVGSDRLVSMAAGASQVRDSTSARHGSMAVCDSQVHDSTSCFTCLSLTEPDLQEPAMAAAAAARKRLGSCAGVTSGTNDIQPLDTAAAASRVKQGTAGNQAPQNALHSANVTAKSFNDAGQASSGMTAEAVATAAATAETSSADDWQSSFALGRPASPRNSSAGIGPGGIHNDQLTAAARQPDASAMQADTASAASPGLPTSSQSLLPGWLKFQQTFEQHQDEDTIEQQQQHLNRQCQYGMLPSGSAAGTMLAQHAQHAEHWGSPSLTSHSRCSGGGMCASVTYECMKPPAARQLFTVKGQTSPISKSDRTCGVLQPGTTTYTAAGVSKEKASGSHQPALQQRRPWTDPIWSGSYSAGLTANHTSSAQQYAVGQKREPQSKHMQQQRVPAAPQNAKRVCLDLSDGNNTTAATTESAPVSRTDTSGLNMHGTMVPQEQLFTAAAAAADSWGMQEVHPGAMTSPHSFKVLKL